jgi:hypothetical protein
VVTQYLALRNSSSKAMQFIAYEKKKAGHGREPNWDDQQGKQLCKTIVGIKTD